MDKTCAPAAGYEHNSHDEHTGSLTSKGTECSDVPVARVDVTDTDVVQIDHSMSREWALRTTSWESSGVAQKHCDQADGTTSSIVPLRGFDLTADETTTCWAKDSLAPNSSSDSQDVSVGTEIWSESPTDTTWPWKETQEYGRSEVYIAPLSLGQP